MHPSIRNKSGKMLKMSKVNPFISLLYIIIIYIKIKTSTLYISKVLSWMVPAPIKLSSRPQSLSPTVKAAIRDSESKQKQTVKENQIEMYHQTSREFAFIFLTLVLPFSPGLPVVTGSVGRVI